MIESLLWFLLIQNLVFILLSIKLICVGYVFYSCYFFETKFFYGVQDDLKLNPPASNLQLWELDVYMSFYMKHISYIHALLKTTSI